MLGAIIYTICYLLTAFRAESIKNMHPFLNTAFSRTENNKFTQVDTWIQRYYMHHLYVVIMHEKMARNISTNITWWSCVVCHMECGEQRVKASRLLAAITQEVKTRCIVRVELWISLRGSFKRGHRFLTLYSQCSHGRCFGDFAAR